MDEVRSEDRGSIAGMVRPIGAMDPLGGRSRTQPPVYRRTATARRPGAVSYVLDDRRVVAMRPAAVGGSEALRGVVCGDALESRVVFDAWLGAGDCDGRFVRLGDVERTAGSVLAAVEVARTAGVPPAVVLVHENLPSGLMRSRGNGALHVAQTLRDRYGPVDAPPCVLVTARAHPPEIYRFRQAGGAHAIDSGTMPLAARRAVLARAVMGERWNHTPIPRVTFTARDFDLLPFLEADVSVNEIARRLGLTDAQVHDGRRGLYRRLQEADCVDFVLSGHTAALAAAALRAGAIWEPLAT